MRSLLLSVLSLVLFVTVPFAQPKKTDYFPPAGSWTHKTPAQLGLTDSGIRSAVNYALIHEAKSSHNGAIAQFQSFGKEPNSSPVGPLTNRSGPAGLIIYKGYIVASWGDPDRVDIVNSVSKSFLSATVGLAVDRGFIKSSQDSVYKYVPFVEVYNKNADTSTLLYPFASLHNRQLTWEVMLRQTSDWEGTLWGKADWQDRPQGDIEAYRNRKRNAPGTVWKYNDVRVNALALAATNVWRRPLPQVLKEYIMDPIGASSTWRWYGYTNSWIILDGQQVQSVSGGGHWGGGMFINAYDMGRFGLLTLHRGNWQGKQLISEQWIKQSLTPTVANTGYGYMNWFLNTNKKLLPSAPEDTWVHIGNGNNIMYCDPDHNLVVVARWIDNNAMDGLIKAVLSAYH
jgi:CubicO group peptidase (beta-lactamase class C family)